ncbi:O-antigen ligase family protein [Flammeovirga yaeyamensis]|uniref:O-antigen ligase family protein n=1 Tax=Flammeovirga yaeyamensis TaxID=367791 RepID=A0AAX1N4H1_9BACT|nr:O-antigen ligase family protein [Flammeovirga yaeyamensis]MBB3699815.1 hypothetical protein [Flammeovirga yaeyamensis]NMF36616.1 hypothetical protein [Flammeovirga yaeyamensis]QWG02337.1 O-antigen ligase family protein [Flammeovirga yaeyamensis]
MFIAIVVNILFSLIVYIIIKKNENISSFIFLVKTNLNLTCSVIIFQFILSSIGLYEPEQYGSNGFFKLGRPTAFFGDPGWVAYWLIILSGILFEFIRLGFLSRNSLFYSTTLLFFAFIINQSRVTIAFVVLNIILILYYDKRSIKYLLVISFISLSVMLLMLVYFDFIEIPENLYYDIVDLSKNPRLYDAKNILTQFEKSYNYILGNGLGSLSRLKLIYPWRNYTNAHNVVILQVINDLGFLGLMIFMLFFMELFKIFKSRFCKILFIEIIILLNFHNIFPYFQLFWFLLILLLCIDRVYCKQIKNYE